MKWSVFPLVDFFLHCTICFHFQLLISLFVSSNTLTLTQVEGVKLVTRLLPYLALIIPYWGIYSQMSTAFQNQGTCLCWLCYLYMMLVLPCPDVLFGFVLRKMTSAGASPPPQLLRQNYIHCITFS